TRFGDVPQIRGARADAHVLFGLLLTGRSDVDEQLVEVDVFGPFDFLDAHGADDAVVKHDLLAQQRRGAHAAHGGEAQEAVVVDVGDDDADFVHVGGDHDAAGRRSALSAATGDDVSLRVPCYFVRQRLHQVVDCGEHSL